MDTITKGYVQWTTKSMKTKYKAKFSQRMFHLEGKPLKIYLLGSQMLSQYHMDEFKFSLAFANNPKRTS